MRMSAYYCDICGVASSKDSLHKLCLLSGDAILKNFSGVCDDCLKKAKKALDQSDAANALKDKADG